MARRRMPLTLWSAARQAFRRKHGSDPCVSLVSILPVGRILYEATYRTVWSYGQLAKELAEGNTPTGEIKKVRFAWRPNSRCELDWKNEFNAVEE